MSFMFFCPFSFWTSLLRWPLENFFSCMFLSIAPHDLLLAWQVSYIHVLSLIDRWQFLFCLSDIAARWHESSQQETWVWFPVSSSLAYYSWHIIFLAITSSHSPSSMCLDMPGQLLLWFYFLLFICLLLHIASSFSCVVVIYTQVTFIFVYYFIFLLASHHQMFCFQHGGICDGMVC